MRKIIPLLFQGGGNNDNNNTFILYSSLKGTQRHFSWQETISRPTKLD